MIEFPLFIERWHPVTLNEMKGHWAKGARLKRRDRDIVWAYARKRRIPYAQGKRRVTLLIITNPDKRGRPNDLDGYTKSLNDALVHARLLRDDGPKWVENAPVQCEKGTKDRWGSLIILTELEGESV